MFKSISSSLVIDQSIVRDEFIVSLISKIEFIEIKIQSKEVCKNNYNARFDDNMIFFKNLFNCLKNNAVLPFVKNPIYNLNFLEDVEIFFIGSIYFSDTLYKYAITIRDNYLKQIFVISLRHSSLENQCKLYNESIVNIKKLLIDISQEISNNTNKLHQYNVQMENTGVANELNNLKISIADLSNKQKLLQDQLDDGNVKLKNISQPSYNFDELIKQFVSGYKKDLHKCVLDIFKNEYQNYEKGNTVIWDRTYLSNHINNIEQIIEPSAFF